MSAGSQRIDKWLFFTRLTKTRGLAQEVVASGVVRLNREKIDQPAKLVRPGDVLTLSLHGRIRVLRVKAPGDRRGPASEAATLYDELSLPAEVKPAGARVVVESRPNPREMALARRLKQGPGEPSSR